MNPLPAESLAAIQNAASMIRRAKKTVILTGAGYSTPSGIPDFRTAGSGLWTKYLPMEVASLTTFRTNPELFFAWLQPLASRMIGTQPNSAHLSLVKLEATGYLSVIITQNIDGLHHRAGNKHVLEIHGTFNSLTCVGCFTKYPSADLIRPYLDYGEIPYCPKCHNLLKPDVILFEEQLPYQTWLKAEEASETCDLMLVAGTSLEVLPSARLPVRALDNGAKLILVNKTETYIDMRADVILRGDVAELMPLLVEEVLGG